MPKEPLENRRKKAKRWVEGKRAKTGGNKIRFRHDDRTLKPKADVDEINVFLERQDIRGGRHRGYRRIFHNGDQTGFRWAWGGRLYSTADDGRSYQSLPEAERLKMTINGEAVREWDLSAANLTVLHGLCGVPLDTTRDPYTVGAGLPREVVKKWMVVSFSLGRFPHAWSEKVQANLLDEDEAWLKGTEGVALPNVQEVQEAVTRTYPFLVEWAREGRWSGFDLVYRRARPS